jgi:hypothetical protein
MRAPMMARSTKKRMKKADEKPGRKKSAQEIPDRLFFRLHCRF